VTVLEEAEDNEELDDVADEIATNSPKEAAHDV
jgi:hypothetical protein